MQLDLRDAARLLGVDESTLSRWIRRGELTARRVHDQYRFDRIDLIEFAAARGIQMPPELVEAPGTHPPTLPNLVEAVRTGGIHRYVPGLDKTAVLRAVVDQLPLPAGTSRDFLLQMLLAREQLGSSGLGQGIAIPHPRSPVILRGAAPSISISFLTLPVDFGAIDGEPVHTLFTILAPSVRIHLHLLARLAAALHDESAVATLSTRAPDEEILAAFARIAAPPSRDPDERSP